MLPNLRGHKVLIPIQENQNLQFISCWLQLNIEPTDHHKHTHTNTQRRIHTSSGLLPGGVKMSFHYTANHPCSFSLCWCVCWQTFHSQRVRENIISELLHEGRVRFGRDDNVPCLTDPRFKMGSYFDVTVSVYKTG